MNSLLQEMGIAAKAAANSLRKASTKQKNEGLLAMEAALYAHQDAILTANANDIAAAEANGLPTPMIERLTLNPQRIKGMADSFKEIAQLPDPIGYVEEMTKSADGLMIGKQRVPLGVIGIIYESRPNVTADASALCFKSGNAVILRGGKEALESNKAIMTALQDGLMNAGFAKETLQLIPDPSRELASEFMKLNDYLDCLIPRGGAGLIQNVLKNATVPVIETGVGNCHLYIDKDAELEMATRILVNAKCSRPSVCNSIETLVVHEAVAETFLPVFAEALAPYKVELRGDAKTCSILPEAVPATEEDFAAEFSDFILAVKVISSYDEAIAHIQKYSTGHSEVIVTDHYQTAQNFLNDIDAAAVYINASSRFTDGGCFGFGGEIGISTQKLHARGPMGLKELTSYKYIIYGEGQIRS
ncbi:glutamate-5-semialdehyde dehydrogenase [Trichococcus pasteurii]|uniref:Gamma-glutamyl phosphate reductase n=1 Tax=Trichococcus pasteurii TaxID=43064 RepID=A0A1W1IH86_9LACT|nr:glutamate-5-semialdehyde dehydrogenase [Trichococcus pasteurii]SFE89055.1 glutamate-5-semialdehyde dehydrogenase [Trichococcus pasteurii]SLM52326.1 proa: glutamate-5-semialdehyde dehydrogenase [Trichococcus pasteurii]SSB93207.1 proa: glutamate-5-semialdehyde dehydrogenase [Trichococcus pasteurii]